MIVVEEFRNDMPLSGISRVSSISLSSFYYKGEESQEALPSH